MTSLPRATKAIIPTAGWGTRRMPVAKSVEKCMLPLGNRPTVDYLVADCVKAGIKDIYFVVSGPAEQLRSYYSRQVELEKYLANKGKDALVQAVTPPEGVRFHFVEQDMHDPRYGTAVPIWICRDYIAEDESVVILMGDAVTYNLDGPSDVEQMVAMEQPVALGIEVGADVDLSKTGGVISLTPDGHYSHIVEHADPEVEPSRIKNCAMYVLPGSVMRYTDDYMRAGKPAYNGEWFFTDVVNEMTRDMDIEVYVGQGEFLDSGDVESWVRANQWLLLNGQL